MLLPKYYEEPSVLHIGTMPDRAYYECSYNSVKNNRILLSGTWKFQYYPEVYDVPDDFMKKDFQVDNLKNIPVPSCWQSQGFGKHQYLCNYYPFPYNPPYPPHENPCGTYLKSFQITKEDLQEKAYLNFEGVDSCFYVWVNEEFVGYSQVSHSTSEFDITSYINEGENKLAVLVLQWCDGSYLEDQDKFRVSGIFRDVYIQLRPQNHIRDFFVKTKLSSDYQEANISVNIEYLDETIGTRCILYDPDDNVICSKNINGTSQNIIVKSPVLWNAEEPTSYLMHLQTEDEIITQRIAIRAIEIKDSIVYLNGNPIKIKGVNRHDSDPVTGATVDHSHVMRDLKMMKAHNINAIRTSHYPNAPWFPDLCTKYGFYLIVEADLESHGAANIYEGSCSKTYGDLIQREIFDDAVMDRVKRCVMRDKNHGSIIMWSLGNESGFSKSLEAAGQWVHEYDGTRLLQYESSIWETGSHKNDTSMLDVYSKMYDSIEDIDTYLNRTDINKPYILCEYAHAMGNSPGDLEDYALKFYSEPRILGGLVWEWCDHAVHMGKADNGKEKYYYGGDFKEILHNNNFCLDGLVYPDRTPHVGLKEYKNILRPIRAKLDGQRTVILENMLDFIDVSKYFDINFEIRKNGQIIMHGDIPLESLKPHQTLAVTIPEMAYSHGIYHLKINYHHNSSDDFIDKGDCAGFDEFCLKDCYQIEAKQMQLKSLDISVSEDEKYTYLKGSKFNYTYNKHTGTFCNLLYEGHNYLDTPMLFNVWRAPIDNDTEVNKKWKDAGYHTAINYGIHTITTKTDNGVEITTVSSITSAHIQEIARLNTKWQVSGDGRINVSIMADKNEIMPNLPRFGLRFFLPKTFEQIAYQGYGPYESYVDKHHASYYGDFQDTVEHMYEDYIKPQENGSHFNSHEISLHNRKREKIEFSSDQTFSFQVSHYTQEELATKKHNYELVESGYTVLCLDYKMSGIGSSACGPKLNSAYQITENHMELKFNIELGGEI